MLQWLGNILKRKKGGPATRTGAHWERVAAKALRKSGMRIVTRNWARSGAHGELDIIARDGPALVFVEVRARNSNALVGGFDSITRHKKEVLKRTCEAYMARLHPKPETYRFDVVEISYLDRRDYELRHFRNVSLFGR